MIEHSAELKDLFAAMAKAQAAVQAASKDKTNPAFRSKYADLASVWDACREPLTANELDITQWPTTVEGGVAVLTVLGHSSGQWMASTLTIPLKHDATAQQIGSALTYARRYMLAAVAGVAPEDDDGQGASQAAPPKEQRKPAKPAPKKETKASDTATRTVENSECRKLWAKYAVEANNKKLPVRDLADFLAEALGKPTDEVIPNEPKWNAIPDKYWAHAARLIMQAKTDLALIGEGGEREPGEDPEGFDDYEQQEMEATA